MVTYTVAPYVGAWIETIYFETKFMRPYVAPYVGAWIETKYHLSCVDRYNCRTLRGCVD